MSQGGSVPNPGSDAAREQGCICPVLDNGHGRGYMGYEDENGEPVFVTVVGCPLHAPLPPSRESESE